MSGGKSLNQKVGEDRHAGDLPALRSDIESLVRQAFGNATGGWFSTPPSGGPESQSDQAATYQSAQPTGATSGDPIDLPSQRELEAVPMSTEPSWVSMARAPIERTLSQSVAADAQQSIPAHSTEEQPAEQISGRTSALADSNLYASSELSSAALSGVPTWWQQATQPIQQVVSRSLPTALSGNDVGWLSSLFSPLVAGLISLFGGGDDDQTATSLPEKFALPPKLDYELGFSQNAGGGLFGVDRTSDGSPRSQRSGADNSVQQVVVQVSAMDSQSIIDRRKEIADAVRLALLESHSLNDQISDAE